MYYLDKSGIEKLPIPDNWLIAYKFKIKLEGSYVTGTIPKTKSRLQVVLQAHPERIRMLTGILPSSGPEIPLKYLPL